MPTLPSYEQLQQQLQESVKRADFLNLIIQNSPGCFCQIDSLGNIIEVNNTCCNLLGYSREELSCMHLGQVLEHPENIQARIAQIKRGQSQIDETQVRCKDGRILTVETATNYLDIDGGHLVCFYRDITMQKAATEEREITIELLQQINHAGCLRELAAVVVPLMQKWSGCEAAAIRLQDGDDYPYFADEGFSSQFIESENSLCHRDSNGTVLHDAYGLPELECMCGKVIRGRVDTALPCFTPQGSFWTNNIGALIANTIEEQHLTNIRRRCHKEGYKSVALVPLRYGEENIGLLQFNDRRSDLFDQAKIALLERLAANLTAGIVARRTADELIRKRAKHQIVVEMALEGIGVVDADFRLTYVNKAMTEMLGYTEQEMLGQPIQAFYFPAAVDEPDIHLQRRKEGVNEVYERYWLHRDGTPIWATVSGRPFKDDNGNFAGSFALVTNITERKRMEQALIESETHYRTLVEGIPDIVMRYDRKGRHLFVSPNIKHLRGRSALSLIDKTHRELGYPEHMCEFWEDNIRRVFENGKPFEAEFKLNDLQGEFILNWRLVPEFDRDGKVGSVLGITRDVSEQRKTEKSYQTLFKEMLNGFARCEIICDDGGKPIDYRFLTVNPAFERITGIKAADIIGRRVLEVLPNTEKSWIEKLGRVALTGDPTVFENPHAGLNLFLEITAFSPAPNQFACIFADIGDRKRAEQALIESETQYRTLVEGIPDVVMRFDRQGRHLFSSPNTKKISGMPYAEVIGKTNREIGFTPEMCDFVEDKIRRTFETATPFEGEFKIDGPYGEKRLNWRLIPEFDQDGTVKTLLSISRDITEQRKKEKEYEILFREMLDGFALHEIICDDEGRPIDYRFLAVNPAFERLTGLKAADIVGRTVLEVLPGTEKYWIDTYGKVALTGEPTFFENFSAELNSHFEVTAFRHTLEQFAAIFVDITERKRMEQALVENEAQYRTLLEGIPDIVMRYDRQGRHLFVSDNIKQLEGKSATSMIGKTHRELGFAPDLCDLWEEEIRRAFDSGKPLETEFKLNVLRGEIFLNWRLVPEFDGQGKVTSLLSLARDVSAQYKTEKSYQTLFKEMLNGFAHCEIICDDEGLPIDYRYIAVNPGFERIIGKEAADVIGRRVLEVFPGTEKGWIEKLCQVALTGEPTLFESYHPQLGIYFEMTAFRPAPRQFGVIFADITERQRAAAEHKKLQEQLFQSQKMESVGRLAGGVAHDFNNKLAIILGNVEMAQEEVDPNEPLHTYLQDIRQATLSSSDLTRQLLAFARKQTIAPKVLDLNDTVQGILKMLVRLIGEDIRLSWMPGSNLWPVRMDPAQIDQLLANLCVNARDAIEGAGHIVIETRNRTLDDAYCAGRAGFIPGEYVLLAVSDNGCGMSSETQKHIFEPFFTTKGFAKGTGLGLATTYGIVKQNNGFINVYSEPGTGTTFTIYLPRHHGVKDEVQVSEGKTLLPGGNERVLLVEDEGSLLTLTKLILTRLGYQVTAASSPREALSIIKGHEREIDILVTDVVMPEMNGRELMEQLLPLNPTLKTLFVSGYTDNVIAHLGVLDKGVNFINKPFSRQTLALKVREMLDQG